MCLFLEQAALSVLILFTQIQLFISTVSHNVKERVNSHEKVRQQKNCVGFFGKISSNFQEVGTNKNNFSHFFVILLQLCSFYS